MPGSLALPSASRGWVSFSLWVSETAHRVPGGSPGAAPEEEEARAACLPSTSSPGESGVGTGEAAGSEVLSAAQG